MKLIVDDDYIDKMSSFISQSLNNMEKDLQEFQKIVLAMNLSGIKQGSTAKALEAFAESLSVLRSGSELTELARQTKMYCSTYKDKIDDADRDLY